MNAITVKDGTQIYYKDWGTGEPVVFSHGWPLNADSWEAQMLFLATHGYRCIAHDRRGHSRSSQPWTGNDMDIRQQLSGRTSNRRQAILYAAPGALSCANPPASTGRARLKRAYSMASWPARAPARQSIL